MTKGLVNFVTNNIDGIGKFVLKQKKANIKQFNPKALGYICSDGTINFSTNKAAQDYAKNRILQALQVDNPFERAVVLLDNKILADVDGIKGFVNLANIKALSEREIMYSQQGFSEESSLELLHGHPEIKDNEGATPISILDFTTMVKLNLKRMVAYNKEGEINSFERVASYASKENASKYLSSFAMKYGTFLKNLHMTKKEQKVTDKLNKRLLKCQKENKSIPQVLRMEADAINKKFFSKVFKKEGSRWHNKLYNDFLKKYASTFGVKYETNFSNLV